MNVKPISTKLYTTTAKSGITHKGIKISQATTALTQNTKPATKNLLKTPFMRKMMLGLMGIGAAVGINSCTAFIKKTPSSDEIVAERIRLYDQSRGKTYEETERKLKGRMSASNKIWMMEMIAADMQQELDKNAFEDILEDNGYEVNWSWTADDKIFFDYKDYVGFDAKDLVNNENGRSPIYNNNLEKGIHFIYKEALKFIMPVEEHRALQKRIKELPEHEDADGMTPPYFISELYQFVGDSVMFRNYIKEKGIDQDPEVIKDFKDICEKIAPRDLFAYTCFYGGPNGGQTYYPHDTNKDNIERWREWMQERLQERFDKE